MTPNFWKLSQGRDHFSFLDLLQSLEDRLVYVGRDAGALGRSLETQAEWFVSAPVGDYFYLTHGNEGGVYLLGQLTGPANFFSRWSDWIDRPFRVIARAKNQVFYTDDKRWWAPNFPSTFAPVPAAQLADFEASILTPYFGIKLSEYGIEIGE